MLMPHPPVEASCSAAPGGFASLPSRLADQWAPLDLPPMLSAAETAPMSSERPRGRACCVALRHRVGSPRRPSPPPAALPCLLTHSPSDERSLGDVACSVVAPQAARARPLLPKLRRAVWCIIAARRLALPVQGCNLHSVEGVSIDLSTPTESDDDGSVELIDMDLCRSFQDDEALITDERRGWIRSMLVRHAASDPCLGYCQGMTLVAGIFAADSKDEDEAYARFKAFMGDVRSLWLPGFPLLQSAMEQFETAAQARGWYKHLQAHGVDTNMYLPQGFLTLFGSWLPLSTLVTCLSILEKGCMTGMVAMAVSVMDLASGRLLSKRSMDDLLYELQALKFRPPEPQALVARLCRAIPRVKATAAGLRPVRRRRRRAPSQEPVADDDSERTLVEWVQWAFTTEVLQVW